MIKEKFKEFTRIITIGVDFYPDHGKGIPSLTYHQPKASGTVADLKASIWPKYMKKRETVKSEAYELRYGRRTILQDDLKRVNVVLLIGKLSHTFYTNSKLNV